MLRNCLKRFIDENYHTNMVSPRSKIEASRDVNLPPTPTKRGVSR